MKLSLDSLTLTNTEPAELIHAASNAGFDMVSLWVQPPPIFPAQLVTPANFKACKAALAATGMSVGPLEVFVIHSAEAIKSFRSAMELGAELGGKSASAIHIGYPNPAKVGELLAMFAEVAAEFGLRVTLEPLAMFPLNKLAQARDVISASGVDGGIVFDAFHLMHGGGTVADLKAIDAGLIRHVQLCDGMMNVTQEQMRYEASYERLYPGDGEFPLVELFGNISTDVTWGIEAPSKQRNESGISAGAQAKEAMAAVRRIIDQIPAAKQSLIR